MTAITQELMDIVESKNWNEDIAQDFYVKWLEGEDLACAEDIQNLNAYVNKVYRNINGRLMTKERNRRRLEDENQETITRELGLDGQAADPCDLLILEEQYEDIVTQLSPLIRRAYNSVVVNGESVEDVAAGGRTTTNVIYQRVHEAKRIIKEGINNG